ncbi:MAG: hypothetical protein H6819_04160 [Phycisphaerales bacterium]|nr:hypothetical protein [Phycisphaerales bacterium]MCB9856393.1 hypothetical protein [Phycisphaerales bacterium]MCB9864524.1 hypothetical protein [Phycisphaerales bacterium]
MFVYMIAADRPPDLCAGRAGDVRPQKKSGKFLSVPPQNPKKVRETWTYGAVFPIRRTCRPSDVRIASKIDRFLEADVTFYSINVCVHIEKHLHAQFLRAGFGPEKSRKSLSPHRKLTLKNLRSQACLPLTSKTR